MYWLLSDADQIGQSSEMQRYFSPIIRTEVIDLTEGFTKFQLNSERILINSEKVSHQETLFERGTDYLFDYLKGEIEILAELPIEITWLEIEYSVIPDDIYRKFAFFIAREYSDTLDVHIPTSYRQRFAFPETQLNITGSKTFSVSVGSEDDFSINQSLFLRIDGELRRNLFVRAQLSDSQSPFTPEGDTRELSNLDQIFIKLYGNEYELSFGDLEIDFRNTQFINYTGRFEGLKFEWFGNNSFQGALAISRGKQSSYDFRGQDGKQGPYYITVTDQGMMVQIIPGSEEVFLNGISLSRGTDYTIDYAEGSITFTSRYFIDSNSLIYVRFQYSDEDYRQNMYFVGNSLAITDKLTLSQHLIVRNDDRNNPLRESFTPDDLQLLKDAGDSPVWAAGVTVAEDSDGNYDLVVDDDGVEYYQYVGIGEGDYFVQFSYVGEEMGDYRQTSFDRYDYVGKGNGNWLPGRLLPTPEYLGNYDIALKWQSDYYSLQGEAIFTRWDQNSFSGKESNDNDGYATHWQLQLNPDYNRWNPEMILYYRFLSKNRQTFADIRQPLLSYDFHEMAEVDTLATSEIGTELSLDIARFIRPNGRYWRKNAKNGYIQDNLVLNTTVIQQYLFPGVSYTYSQANRKPDNTIGVESLVRQNRVESSYNLRPVRIAGTYQHRIFREKRPIQESYITDNEPYWLETGNRFRSQSLTLGSYNTRVLAGQLFIREEDNDIFDDELWRPVRKSRTIGGESYLDYAEQRVRTAYSRVEIDNFGTDSDRVFDVAEINTNNSLLQRGVSLNANYILKNIEFYPKMRELVFVGSHHGIYDSTGVAVEDGEYDYKVIQVGDPEMSIEVNADFQLNISPRMFFTEERGTITPTKLFLNRFQFDNYLLVTENSRAEKRWDVYLLKPSVLMSEANTIFGRTLVRHTTWFDLVRGRILSKVMLQNDRTLDNRFQDRFRLEIESRELMLRFSRYWQTDFELTYENREERESRYDSFNKSDALSLDIRNRLANNLQLSTLLSYNLEEGDRQTGGASYRLRSYRISESLTYFFQRRYRLFTRVEYRYNKRDGSAFMSFLPEKRGGNIFRWNARLNYQLNHHTTASFEYRGDNYPLQDMQHQIKVEFRAEF